MVCWAPIWKDSYVPALTCVEVTLLHDLLGGVQEGSMAAIRRHGDPVAQLPLHHSDQPLQLLQDAYMHAKLHQRCSIGALPGHDRRAAQDGTTDRSSRCASTLQLQTPCLDDHLDSHGSPLSSWRSWARMK